MKSLKKSSSKKRRFIWIIEKNPSRISMISNTPIVREYKQMYSKWLAFDYWLSFECFILKTNCHYPFFTFCFELLLLIHHSRCHVIGNNAFELETMEYNKSQSSEKLTIFCNIITTEWPYIHWKGLLLKCHVIKMLYVHQKWSMQLKIWHQNYQLKKSFVYKEF